MHKWGEGLYKMRLVAQYKCLKCLHEWNGECGPTICPKCNHVYVKWLNYDELFGEKSAYEQFKAKRKQ